MRALRARSKNTSRSIFTSNSLGLLFAVALLAVAGSATADDITGAEPIVVPTEQVEEVEDAPETETVRTWWTPFQLSFITPLQILPSHWPVRGLAINLLYGNQDDVRGLDLGFVNVAGDMRGMQLGIVNGTPGLMRGAQFGGANWAEEGVRGLQLGVFNMAGGEGVFGQVGLFNTSKVQTGSQIGLYNRSESLRGVQLGLFNINLTSNLYGYLPIFNVGW